MTLANSVNKPFPLSIANGGTGEATATQAFDFLAPSTTKGDLIVFNGTDNVRLGVGTDTYVLTADAASSTGIKWAAGGGGGGVSSVSGTANRITSTGGATPVIDISASYVGQNSITTLGTIGTGTWQGTVVGATYGGTGVNNGASTITLGGSLTTSGAFASTFTMTNTTTVTFPTTGTLATTSQIPSGAALTKTDDTNVTLTLGGSPTTALVNSASLTLGWTGQLSLAKGGTNANLTASNGGIFYSTASAGAILAGTATANQLLLSGASTTPVWSTLTHPATCSSGDIIYGSASNVLSGLAIGSYPGSPLIQNDSSLPAWGTPRTYVYYYDDFLTSNGVGWSPAFLNSGSQSNTGQSSANPGVVALTTVTSTNAACINRFGGASSGPFTVGGGYLTCTFYAKLATLSDGTNTYTARIGFGDASTGSKPTDGCWFEYTDGTNSGAWQILTGASSSYTTQNTSNTADTSWHRYRVDINAGGTSVAFYIDDTQVANSPITTNIPSTSIGLFWQIIKSAGATARTFAVDFVSVYQKLTSSR